MLQCSVNIISQKLIWLIMLSVAECCVAISGDKTGLSPGLHPYCAFAGLLQTVMFSQCFLSQTSVVLAGVKSSVFATVNHENKHVIRYGSIMLDHNKKVSSSTE